MAAKKKASSLDDMLRALEAAEANLLKAERLWRSIEGKIPAGVAFGGDRAYEDLCRRFQDVIAVMPAIEGFRVTERPLDLNAIAQMRHDAREIDELEAIVGVEESVAEPGRSLAEYRHRFDRKRRQLIRGATLELVAQVDKKLGKVDLSELDNQKISDHVPDEGISPLRELIRQIATLLGSSVKQPPRWGDLQRHLSFGQVGDLRDILALDWPAVRPALVSALYGEDEPIPVNVTDLSDLAEAVPRAVVPTRLTWDRLKAEDFERLIYALLKSDPVYENVDWLMHTNAPDRGRDVSAWRVTSDLSGTRRERVIVQCKHWLTRSVAPADLAALKEQLQLWQPPRVDIAIIATSGRFSVDAVRAIELQNQSDSALRIETWPESHLEMLLAQRPSLIAEFGLR
jgi:hypothetical protein